MKYQKFFPQELRINESNLPIEEWWEWNDYHVHLDLLPVSDSKIKVILIHSAGGNGRLFAPYARMLQIHGYDVVCPDLPPYGLSYTESLKSLDYLRWIELLTKFLNMKPMIAPESFEICPVLLVHPEVDPMIPFALS
jgi:pimeloyl-ACP methyl ester carboxylesterase